MTLLSYTLYFTETSKADPTYRNSKRESVSLNRQEMKAKGLRTGSPRQLTSRLKDALLLPNPFSEGFGSEGSLTDSRRLRQARVSRLYRVPEPEERLLFLKARRIPQTWPELYCRQDGGRTASRLSTNMPAYRCTSCEITDVDATSVSSQRLGGLTNPPS